MEKLSVYFKNIKLGELYFKNENFIYVANKCNVKKALNKGYPLFLYHCENDFVSDILPPAFEDILPKEEQIDLILLAGITESDNKFERLYKIAKLDLAYDGLYLKV